MEPVSEERKGRREIGGEASFIGVFGPLATSSTLMLKRCPELSMLAVRFVILEALLVSFG
jgi:hypothetical protein